MDNYEKNFHINTSEILVEDGSLQLRASVARQAFGLSHLWKDLSQPEEIESIESYNKNRSKKQKKVIMNMVEETNRAYYNITGV